MLILGRPPNRIDILTQPDGISWDECWNRRVSSDYAGEPIAYLALEDLLASKLAAGRDQDLVDAKKPRLVADRLRKENPAEEMVGAAGFEAGMASSNGRHSHAIGRTPGGATPAATAALPTTPDAISRKTSALPKETVVCGWRWPLRCTATRCRLTECEAPSRLASLDSNQGPGG